MWTWGRSHVVRAVRKAVDGVRGRIGAPLRPVKSNRTRVGTHKGHEMALASARGVTREVSCYRHVSAENPPDQPDQGRPRRIHLDLWPPRVTHTLRQYRCCVNHTRVECPMREHDVVGVTERRRIRTTIQAEHAPSLPDLANQHVAPGQPDVDWCGEIRHLGSKRGLVVGSVKRVAGVHRSFVAVPGGMAPYRQRPAPRKDSGWGNPIR